MHFLAKSRMIFRIKKNFNLGWTRKQALLLYMTASLGNYYTIYGSISVCKLAPLRD